MHKPVLKRITAHWLHLEFLKFQALVSVDFLSNLLLLARKNCVQSLVNVASRTDIQASVRETDNFTPSGRLCAFKFGTAWRENFLKPTNSLYQITKERVRDLPTWNDAKKKQKQKKWKLVRHNVRKYFLNPCFNAMESNCVQHFTTGVTSHTFLSQHEINFTWDQNKKIYI